MPFHALRGKERKMDTLGKLFEFAVAKEQEAAAFYEFLASAAGKENIRAVFLELALTEKGHKKIFEDIIKGGSHNPSTRTADLDLHISEYLVEIPFNPDMNYQDALIVGMKREEQSNRFYLDLSKAVSDRKLSQVLSAMAEEELRHKIRLESLYDKDVLTED